MFLKLDFGTSTREKSPAISSAAELRLALAPSRSGQKLTMFGQKKSVTVNLKKAIRKWRASIICFIVALELSMIFKQQAVDSYAVPAGQDKNFPFILVFSFSNYS